MKFVCDKCNTKYSIADERVHGRVLKIRCKTCDHIITVREGMGLSAAMELHPHEKPQPRPPAKPMISDLPAFDGGGDERTVVSSMAPSTAQVNDPAPGDDEWYVSFDGDQEGPFPLERALERVREERPRGKEVHCWRPGFFVWLPVEEVPEFGKALGARPAPMPPPPKPVKNTTGSRPALKGTGPKPVVRRDPTGPRAALQAMPGGAPKDVAPQMDSKPLPLPPPPEPAPAPMSLAPAQETRPEPRAARKIGSSSGASAAVTTKHEDTPAKKPAAAAAAPAPAKQNGNAPELSPFAAALAASGLGDKPPDTGPVPLPPPPGEELPIGEPSGLLNISHLAMQTQGPPRPASRPQETFGGQPVTPTPASGPNGIGPSGVPNTSAPVVVVAGPAPRHAPWMKWAAIGGGALSLLLAGTLVFVLTRPPKTIVKVELPSVPRKVVAEEPPIAINDPGVIPTATAAGATTEKKPAPAPGAAAKRAPAPKAPPVPGKSPSLSSDQKALAALYGESGDRAVSQHNVPAPSAAARPAAEVSQQAIANVVTSNRRALNLCYDRVLKRDSSLKRARLDVHVKIGISGSVVNATPAGDQAGGELGTCIAQTVKRWHFPSSDSEYETEFPLVFQAQ